MAESRFSRDHPEYPHSIGQRWYLSHRLTSPIRCGDHQRCLEARHIERLRRGGESNAAFACRIRNLQPGCMRDALENQRSVDLISEYPTTVAGAEVGDLIKLGARHHAAGWIVGIGQHQGAYAAGKCRLQRFKINYAGSTQREQHEFDPRLWQLGKERRDRPA